MEEGEVMEEYKRKVINESLDLEEKLVKLEKFLLEHDKGEFPLLEIQLPVMKTYLAILNMRIEKWMS